MDKAAENLDSVVDQLREVLTAKDRAREQALSSSREVIRHASNIIRAVHRHEFTAAGEMLQPAYDLLKRIKNATADYGEICTAGFVRDAEKELAEASCVIALVTGQSLPDPLKIGLDPAAYLNGLGEAVGELRRYLLDGIRSGDMSHAEDLLSAMNDIYSILITIDYPDAITGGLRRTTDNVRGILEKTRSDLTLIVRQKELERRLDNFKLS